MHKLCVKLPPFSPDYSGVCSALFDLGGLIAIHDASGCTGNYTGYDEPRWYGSSNMIYCSNLREIDAVMGNDQRLIEKVLAAAQDLNPAFVAVLGSPVPMVVGADMEGIAAEIEQLTGIPSFGFDVTGLDFYDRGVGRALLALAKRFALPPGDCIPRSINILGATPLDFGINGDAADIKRFFKTYDYQVICDYAMHSSLDDIRRSGQAQANVVISPSGLPLARYFYKEFGTPYVSGLPVGESASAQLLLQLAMAIETGVPQLQALPQQAQQSQQQAGDTAADTTVAVNDDASAAKQDTLVIHNQLAGNALRTYLMKDCEVEAVDVATLFDFCPEHAAPGDAQLPSELSVKQKINSGYHTVIADPLLQQLVEDQTKTHFIPLPHIAVSSRLHWDDIPKLIGVEPCVKVCGAAFA